MALPNPIVAVQGARLSLGPDTAGIEDTFLINPGQSDYPVNGYVITALQLRLKLITFAWITGFNNLATGYVPQIEFPLAQLASAIIGGGLGGPGQGLPFSQTAGAGITGYSQVNFTIFTGAAAQARLTEATVNTDFLGCGWLMTVRGQ